MVCSVLSLSVSQEVIEVSLGLLSCSALWIQSVQSQPVLQISSLCPLSVIAARVRVPLKSWQMRGLGGRVGLVAYRDEMGVLGHPLTRNLPASSNYIIHDCATLNGNVPIKPWDLNTSFLQEAILGEA